MIYIATDHTGFELKEKLKQILADEGYEVEDCGALEYDKDDDYPDFIAKAAEKVSKNPESFGIVMGGSGQGEAIVCNKYPNVRCATFYTPALAKGEVDVSGNKSSDPYEILKLTRAHNNSNILSLGVRFLTVEEAEEAVKIFLKSPFTKEERHSRRIEKIKKIEENL